MKKYIKPELTVKRLRALSHMLIGSETDQEVTDGGAAKLSTFYNEDEE